MRKNLLTTSAILAGNIIAADLLYIGTAYAQVAEDEIVTVGTRRQARTAQDSIAPIDVIPVSTITRQGDNDLSNLLRTAVPSFNVNAQGINDAATVVRPANLRGLSPDQTLVLINGKRLHRAAVITFLGGGVSDGAQGPDISSIPSLALKQVEVLRDGAASQYGSDAIAGVINFSLNDSREGGTFTAKYGSTYEGDGENYQFAGNIGLPIGDEGFLNLTGEFQERDATSRSIQRADAAALIAAGNTAVADIVQVHGDPEVRNDLKLFANFGTPIGENIELYGIGTYAERAITGPFFFRNPSDRGGIFTGGPNVDPLTGVADPNGVAAVRVGDLSVDTVGDCPAGIPLTAGGGLLPDPTILAQVAADPNCFSFVELFPGGFTPSFSGDVEDWSVHGGIKGEIQIGTGLGYDLSFRHGESNVDFGLSNAINASLGPNTPTEFETGGYGSTLDVLNADFNYGIPVDALASDLNVAFGFEYRDETFIRRQGDAASFAQGPLAAPSSAFPLGQGFNSNSDGFAGFSTSTENSQDSTGYYLDLEADVIESLTLQGAIRYEDTEFFGDTTNFKVGALYRFNDDVRLRGTYSTGFRVPTAGQVNVINTATTVGANGQLVDSGTFPLFSPAGQIIADFVETPVSQGGLGGVRPTLNPESSDSFTFGLAFDFANINFTVDYFNISLDDRISISDEIDFLPALQLLAGQNNVTLTGTTTAAAIAELSAAGVVNSADFTTAGNLASFNVFTNDFDTKTQGVDIIATGPIPTPLSGDTDFTLAFNYTDTEVTRAGQNIGAGRISELENGLPNVRGNLTVNHYQGPWRVLARGNYFGSFIEDHFSFGGIVFPVSDQITFDAEVGYNVNEQFELVVGANNIFDSDPDDNPSAEVFGARFPVTAPGGFNGGSWYVKAVVNF